MASGEKIHFRFLKNSIKMDSLNSIPPVPLKTPSIPPQSLLSKQWPDGFQKRWGNPINMRWPWPCTLDHPCRAEGFFPAMVTSPGDPGCQLYIYIFIYIYSSDAGVLAKKSCWVIYIYPFFSWFNLGVKPQRISSFSVGLCLQSCRLVLAVGSFFLVADPWSVQKCGHL